MQQPWSEPRVTPKPPIPSRCFWGSGGETEKNPKMSLHFRLSANKDVLFLCSHIHTSAEHWNGSMAVIKPSITQLFSKTMLSGGFFRGAKLQVASAEAQPSSLQQMPSASAGKTVPAFCPTKSGSNGTKAMAGLRCVATWQMSPRGKTWGSTQARDLGSQVSSTPGSMVKGGLSVILRCPGGEVPVPAPVIPISVCPSVNHQMCPYSHNP